MSISYEPEELGTTTTDTALEQEEGQQIDASIPLPTEVVPPDHSPGAVPPTKTPLDDWLLAQGNVTSEEAAGDVGDA